MKRTDNANVREKQSLCELSNAGLAEMLANPGMKVFPCREKTGGRDRRGKPFKVKSPYTPRGLYDASSDIHTVRDWWRRWPDALVGVVPGQVAVDALVLDLDVGNGKDGIAAFKKLMPDQKDVPFVRTLSGGEHMWFARPEGGHGNEQGKLAGQGIDVRCDNGYVCFGRLPDGTRYEADEVLKTILEGGQWPELPADILKMLRSGSTKKVREAENYFHNGKLLCDVEKVLLDWRGNQGPDQGPSGQFASLFERAVDRVLAATHSALGDHSQEDLCLTVHEVIARFLGEAEGDPAALAGAHMERRGSYSIRHLMAKRTGQDPERAPETVKATKALERLRATLETGKPKPDDGKGRPAKSANEDEPSWVSDTYAAVKKALRELAASGVEDSDPMEFARLKQQIASKAASYGLDLHEKVKSGSRKTLLDATYEAERKALVAERRALAGKSDEGHALTAKGDLRLTDFLYLPTKNRYIHTPSGGLWVAEGVDEAVAGEAPSVVLRQTRRVDGVVWDPGQNAVVEGMTVVENYMVPHKGSFVYNTHKPATVRLGNADKAGPWVDHIRLLYPNEADEIFDAFAFFSQNPGEKINWGWFQLGSPGIGKDFSIAPLRYIAGEHNTKIVRPEDIRKDFDEFKQSQLLIINELTDYGNIAKNNPKYALHEALKPLLAAPPEYFTVNPKYGMKTVARNVCFVIGMSNHYERALYLPPDDRRHFVSHTEVTREEFGETKGKHGRFWDDRYRWMNGKGREHILAFLDERDVSLFSPGAPPRRTKAWQTIVDFNKSKEQIAAEEHQDVHGDWPDAVDIAYLLSLRTLPNELKEFFGTSDNRNRFGEKMREFGYLKVDNPAQSGGRWKIQGQNTTIFVHRDVLPDERADAAREWRDKRNSNRN